MKNTAVRDSCSCHTDTIWSGTLQGGGVSTAGLRGKEFIASTCGGWCERSP